MYGEVIYYIGVLSLGSTTSVVRLDVASCTRLKVDITLLDKEVITLS